MGPAALELWHPFTLFNGQIQDGGQRPKFQSLNGYNSAADCSISLKFGTKFDHMTAATLQTYKIEGSKVSVRARRNVSAVKTL